MTSSPPADALVDSLRNLPVFGPGEHVLVLMGSSGVLERSTRRLLPLLALAGEVVGASLWVQFYDSTLHGQPVPLRTDALPTVVQGDMGCNLRKCLTDALGQAATLPDGQALDRVVVGFDPFDAAVKPARWGSRIYPSSIVVPDEADFTVDGVREINPDRAVMDETTMRILVERLQLQRTMQDVLNAPRPDDGSPPTDSGDPHRTRARL